jgi:hypothetical protein
MWDFDRLLRTRTEVVPSRAVAIADGAEVATVLAWVMTRCVISRWSELRKKIRPVRGVQRYTDSSARWSILRRRASI